MAQRTCTAPNCHKPRTYGRLGLCVMHYYRLRLHGSLDDPRPTIEQRFWSKVDKGDGTGCWLWTRAVNNKGYGVFRLTTHQSVYAHRYAYELLSGPIPEGRELDHIQANGCTSTACVKAIGDQFGPTHLEPVTHRENMLRSDTPSARQARQTHCIRGHELTEENVYRRPSAPNKRECRPCVRIREMSRPPRRRDGR